MALDYSKLSDDELEAIANNDYGRLSDTTLTLLSQEAPPVAPESMGVEMVAPQALTVGRELAKGVPAVASTGMDLARQGIQAVAARPLAQTAADVAGLASHGVPWGTVAQTAMNANPASVGQAVGKAVDVAKAVPGAVARGATGLGGAVLRGVMAPESLLTLPYQMAAYEQEKIRQNPNAPGLERNPYAMTVRGEAPTQGAAGAMNQRRAVVGMPITGVTDDERRILEEDQKRRLDLLTRYEAARRILGR